MSAEFTSYYSHALAFKIFSIYFCSFFRVIPDTRARCGACLSHYFLWQLYYENFRRVKVHKLEIWKLSERFGMAKREVMGLKMRLKYHKCCSVFTRIDSWKVVDYQWNGVLKKTKRSTEVERSHTFNKFPLFLVLSVHIVCRWPTFFTGFQIQDTIIDTDARLSDTITPSKGKL